MKRIVRLTDSDLTRIVKRIIMEKTLNDNIFTKNGYELHVLNDKYKKFIDTNEYPNIYKKGETILASDDNNENFYFIVAPEGVNDLGPYPVENYSHLLKN